MGCPLARRFAEALSWVSTAGAVLLGEERTIAVRSLGNAWALDVSCALSNVTEAPLAVGSPATNGRPGAGYGGFFWRAPGGSHGVGVVTPSADGEAAAHGTRSPWLAMSGMAGEDAWTLVFVAADARTREDPWFVRVSEYPGVGSSLAWERPLWIEPGGVETRRIVTVVADGAALPLASIKELLTLFGDQTGLTTP